MSATAAEILRCARGLIARPEDWSDDARELRAGRAHCLATAVAVAYHRQHPWSAGEAYRVDEVLESAAQELGFRGAGEANQAGHDVALRVMDRAIEMAEAAEATP